MTYTQIKYIPDSRHVFYRYAFQTLYTLHDASKQGYQRKRYVEMSESDFIHVFSLFCLASYADHEHSFEKESILSYIQKAKVRSGIDFECEMFLRECAESVNLIYKEGDQYTFIHRTFQEYFCAYAATHYFPDKVDSVIAYLPIRHTDSVFSMMYLMNADVLSKMYIRPTYERLHDSMNAIMRKTDVRDILGSVNVSVEIFFDSDIKLGHFGYMTNYDSEIKRFVDSMVCIFKSELPFEKSGDYIRYESIKSLVSSTLRAFKLKKTRTHKNYQASFVFGDSTITLTEMDKGKAVGDRKERIVNMFESDDLSYLNAFADTAQSFKAELVFSKRKCDELLRKQREISKKGDGILSL